MDMQSLQANANNASIPSGKISPHANQPDQDSFWGKDGFTFGDVIDMINPLHHLPVISTYYREQTDDDASEGSRLIGGAFFGGLMGGVTGLLTSMAGAAVRHETHQDVTEHLLDIAEESFDDISSFAANESLSDNLHDDSRDISDLNKLSTNIPQLASALQGEINPFFAQALEENSNVLFYASELQNASIQRPRDWGKV